MFLFCGGVASMVIVRSIRETREYAAQSKCAYNLHEIGVACRNYADKHNGVFPDSFLKILKDVESLDVFISPLSGRKPGKVGEVDSWADYVLVRGITAIDTNKALAYYFQPLGSHKRGTILLADGTILRSCGNAEFSKYVANLEKAGDGH